MHMYYHLAYKFIKQLFDIHERYNQIRNQILKGEGGVGRDSILALSFFNESRGKLMLLWMPL